jgi:hypothetical protein
MARSDDNVRRRAARAYERGRVTAAAGLFAPIAFLLVCVPIVTGSGPLWSAVGGVLALAGAAAAWRGGLAGRAARAGLLAGLAPLVAPIAVGAFGHRCSDCGLPASLPLCIAACVAAGTAAGAILGLVAGREGRRALFAATAVGFAGAAGALGCVFAGASGLLGMGIGLALGSAAPLLAAARSSR